MFFFWKLKKKKFQKALEEATEAFKRGNYNQAEKLMKKWSKRGFADASELLYRVLKARSRKAPDRQQKNRLHDEMIQMMIKAAEQGSAECQFQCGLAFEFPDQYQLQIDYPKAFRYYQMGAKQGHNRAINNLGCMYQFGRGVERDMQKALSLYEEAVTAGNPRGHLGVGYMYQYGKGVQLSLYEAKNRFYLAKSMAEEMLYLAKEQNDTEQESQHQRTINEAVTALEKIEVEFACLESRSLKEANPDKAEKELLKLANEGKGRAQFELGLLYDDRKQFALAAKWYKKAGENGLGGGMANLAAIYYFGKGVAKNYKLAFVYFKKAEEMTGNKWAIHMLGRMYEEGYYVKKDYIKAVEMYQKAARQNEPNALARIGYMYEKGFGLPQDYKKAAEYYLRVEDEKIMYVESRLGDLYAKGLGVKKDLNRAIDLMGRAAAQGSQYSKDRLTELNKERMENFQLS